MVESIAPVVTTLNAPHWQAAARGEFVLPFCVSSNRAFWPPSPLSPFVSCGPVEWRAIDPVGIVDALVVYRRPFQKPFEPMLPYGIALVALDAGPRLLAHIPKADEAGAPGRGDRVRLRHRIVDPHSLLIAEVLR